MDCTHKREGCIKCGEYAADRGINCCAECSDEGPCSGRCEWALLLETRSMLSGTPAPAPVQLPQPVELMTAVSAFDYSEVDADTASFLRQKEIIIGGYMHRTRFDVGQELKEAQERLAQHRYGCFVKWATSVGFKESTVYELINYHSLILRHAEKRDMLEAAPFTLVREIAKPSADPELKQKVLDGDITSHKQYQELLRQKRETDTAAATAKETVRQLKQELADRPEVEVEKPPADYEVLKTKAAQAEKLQQEISRLQKSDQKLVELQQSIGALQDKRSDLATQINASVAISPFVSDARELVKKLAPIKYSQPLSELRNNESVKETLLSLVGSVRSWCDEMDDLLIRNIKRTEEVIDIE